VTEHHTTLKEAREKKAMALFEGKYDDEVRMIEIGTPDKVISRELCGGTHISNTTEIGLFMIKSEAGIAAGVRRITALTGMKAYKEFVVLRESFENACTELSSDAQQFNQHLRHLIADRDEKVRELKRLKRELSGDMAGDIMELGDFIGDINVITADVKGVTNEELLDLADKIRQKSGEKAAIFLTHSSPGRVNMLIMLTVDMVEMGFKAVKLMNKVAPILGGRGGGKGMLAQGGGNIPDNVPQAFDAFKKAIKDGIR
jgi:alanyl-tRNA synthetase